MFSGRVTKAGLVYIYWYRKQIMIWKSKPAELYRYVQVMANPICFSTLIPHLPPDEEQEDRFVC